MWSKVMKKEAVHVLMLNKINSNIQTIKEGSGDLTSDKGFEDALFEISTTSRDIKNQVTFKLKDEFYGWFDPFNYICFDEHS